MNTEPRKPRVLYVEDEEALRNVVSEYLEAIGGYEVRAVEDGQKGVEMAESWRPDFILMDVRMPVMSGYEATRILRSKPETATTPIYNLTAYSDKNTIELCQEAGSDGFFTKPPSFKSIISTIDEVLKRRNSA